MADVTMPLSELKAYEAKIEELKAANALLQSEQKQVVVLHKYFRATVSPKSNQRLHITGVATGNYGKYGKQTTQAVDGDFSLGRAIELGLVDVNLQSDPDKTSKEYMNLSEVIQQVHAEEKEKVRSQLDEAFERARKAEYDASTVNERTSKELLTMKETYQDLEKDLRKETAKQIKENEERSTEALDRLSENYDTLKQEFDDLKSDKKRVSLEKQIEELTAMLEHERKRSAWDIMWGLNKFKS